MSKSNKESVTAPPISSYGVSRFESGYFITKYTIVDGKVTSSVKVSEPDVLSICMSTLERLVRKENGL